MKRFTFMNLILLVLIILSLAACTSLPPVLTRLEGILPTMTTAVSQQATTTAPTSATGTATEAKETPVRIVALEGTDLEPQLYEAVYERVNPSVVYIENQTRLTRSNNLTLPASSGSGFVWDTQGHIVTNNHVVTGADRLQVTFFDGVTLPAELVGTDPDSDLAVIKVDPKIAHLVPVTLGDISQVKVGQRAIAIGNPFGLVGTMTTGIVSAIGRSLPSNPESIQSYNIPQVIQTDAAINPGNSGGPLLNDRGEVIGVNFQIRSDGGTNSGVGFAIPVNIVQRVVPALIADGKYQHAYLGIRGQTYSPAWAEALGFSADVRGAYVMEVVSGGPAGRAGLRGATTPTDVILGLSAAGPVYLQGGGDLIIAIDGQPVKTFDDILVYLENYKSPGDKVELTVLRAGSRGEVKITVTLAARPQAQ
ncbi:MAG: trypsin-like peptidase domain-containing protein [Anaerolineae bacterium]|nr:trypsin-like peptidase domain-containing protein [Anaerolineae bacterium]